MTPAPAPIIAPKTRNKSLAMMPSYLRSMKDQIDPAKKPIAAQTTRAPFVQRNDLSMAKPRRLSWGLRHRSRLAAADTSSTALVPYRNEVPAGCRAYWPILRRELSRASGVCSGVWLPPPKYRNKEACNQDNDLDAHLYPVPDRRGISISNPIRPVQKIIIEVRDFSLDKATPQFAAAIQAQIDGDDASEDFIKKKPHANIRSEVTGRF
jgi:hypothetical protein